MSKQETVYLAGSVQDHTSIQDANKWRLEAEDFLTKCGYRVLNPIRGKKHTIDGTPKEIVERDLEDIKVSDIILVEMDDLTKRYIGTAMEIRDAWINGKKIILWGMACRQHPWLKYHAHSWFHNLSGALYYLERRARSKRKVVSSD